MALTLCCSWVPLDVDPAPLPQNSSSSTQCMLATLAWLCKRAALPTCATAALQGMLATLQLVRRQDMLAYTVMALQGQKDVLELEVRCAVPCCAVLCVLCCAVQCLEPPGAEDVLQREVRCAGLCFVWCAVLCTSFVLD